MMTAWSRVEKEDITVMEEMQEKWVEVLWRVGEACHRRCEK